MDLIVEGPVVRRIQEDFLRNWKHFAANTKQEYLPQPVFAEASADAGTLKTRYVQSRPWLGEYHTMEALVTAFQMARKRILLTSQYLVLPECLLREALLEAAWRGVEVHILTNSHNTGQEVGFAAGHMVTLRYCSILLEAGIHLYQMVGPEEEEMPKPYLHAKTFLIDGEWAAVGSFNLSVRSCYIESENLLVVQDEAFAAEQESLFWERVRRNAVELTEPALRELKEKYRTALAVAGYLDLFF